MSNSKIQSSILIFGATGDLTDRKLIPALFNQYCKGRLPEKLRIFASGRREFTDESIRQHYQEGLQSFSPDTYDDAKWQKFASQIFYVKANLNNADDFKGLDKALKEYEGDEPADRLYYLAISPNFFELTIEFLGQANMHIEDNGARKIIIEKPFGTDLASATELNKVVHSVFNESQVYRIDHYLGKETAQNILFFRFANHVFENVWSRAHIDNVQITVTETVDVGHRAGYYDGAGVMRDMMQNHLMQLLTLIAMEPPASFNATELRNEKVKVLKSVRAINLKEAVRGQYEGYRDAEGVAENSLTPTYAALKLYIDNWRWQGVPFYLRSGKALKAKATEVVLQFKKPPRMMFDMEIGQQSSPNVLTLCIQPDEGIHFQFEAKVPNEVQETAIAEMDWNYDTQFGDGAIPEAYERLLVDALNGDASLFIRSDWIEEAWRIVDPVIKAWEKDDGTPLQSYPAGSWGPEQADKLLNLDQFTWLFGCMND